MNSNDSSNYCCKKYGKNHKKLMLEGLFWPAAAGNVFWAIIQVCVKEWYAEDILAKIFPLLLLAVYLAMDWLRTIDREDNEIDCYYVVADLFLIFWIVLFTNVTVESESKQFCSGFYSLEFLLSIIFLFAVFGHSSGVWDRGKIRWWLTGINAFGPVVLGLSHSIYPWNLTVALFVVIATWYFFNENYRPKNRI